MLMESPAYREIFPHIKKGLKWSAHEMYVQRRGTAIDATLHARGVDTIGAGSRADLLIFDDVCDQDNSTEEARRRKVLKKIQLTWMTRLEANSCMALWVGTPYHLDDATHHYVETPGWGSLIQKAWPLERGCAGHDLEVVLNPVPGQILPPYPAPAVWEPGQPPPRRDEVRWIQP
jgi:hypothetical protein